MALQDENQQLEAQLFAEQKRNARAGGGGSADVHNWQGSAPLPEIHTPAGGGSLPEDMGNGGGSSSTSLNLGAASFLNAGQQAGPADYASMYVVFDLHPSLDFRLTVLPRFPPHGSSGTPRA
jgi:hypothetical protein